MAPASPDESALLRVPSVLGRLTLCTLLALGTALAVLPVLPLLPRREALLSSLLHKGVQLGHWMFGIRQVTVGAQPPAGDEPLLVVANHRTGIDSAVVENMIDARSLGKDRVARWPIFGRLARARGTVFLNKEGAGSRVAALRGVRDALEQGDSIIVFPEGIIRPGDTVDPFHRGAFAAARGYRVVCIGLAYPPSYEWLKQEPMPRHLWGLLWRGRIPVGVSVGTPFEVGQDARAAADEARRRTQALVHQARAALESRGA